MPQSAGSALPSGSKDLEVARRQALWLKSEHPENGMEELEGGMPEGRWKEGRRKTGRKQHHTTGWPTQEKRKKKDDQSFPEGRSKMYDRNCA